MQVPALFRPMSLGAGFGFFGDDDFAFPTNNIFSPDSTETAYTDSGDVNLVLGIDYDSYDYQDVIDPNYDTYDFQAVVTASGDVTTSSGAPIATASDLQKIAATNPSNPGKAIADTLKITSPDWTKQFKSTDDLVKAAYNLFNTSKAIVQGKPIPPSIQSPYVYNPNDPNMVRRTTAATQTNLSSTNMLLIGGVALAAFLVLRKK